MDPKAFIVTCHSEHSETPSQGALSQAGCVLEWVCVGRKREASCAVLESIHLLQSASSSMANGNLALSPLTQSRRSYKPRVAKVRTAFSWQDWLQVWDRALYSTVTGHVSFPTSDDVRDDRPREHMCTIQDLDSRTFPWKLQAQYGWIWVYMCACVSAHVCVSSMCLFVCTHLHCITSKAQWPSNWISHWISG